MPLLVTLLSKKVARFFRYYLRKLWTIKNNDKRFCWKVCLCRSETEKGGRERDNDTEARKKICEPGTPWCIFRFT